MIYSFQNVKSKKNRMKNLHPDLDFLICFQTFSYMFLFWFQWNFIWFYKKKKQYLFR